MLLKEKRSMKDIANSNYVSPTKIMNMLKLVSYDIPKSLPSVLSIDEFKGNAGYKKFQCILTDPVHKRLIEILPGRESHEITNFLRQYTDRSKVKFVVMDMNKAYLNIAKAFFPKAKVVIDRFHVARYNTWAFENVRRGVQGQLAPSLRKYFKRSRKLLLTRMSLLSGENKQAVNVMLGLAPGLTYAYLLKEKFYWFMDAENSDEANIRLKEFFIFAKQLNVPEYKSCIRILSNWKEYILNAFDCPYSNGYTEGINNKIKVIKRIAFGFRNFENFRKRIYLASTKTG
jgi:transposase